MDKPNVVLVKLRINDKRADELKALGLYYHERTAAQDAMLRQRQEQQAIATGVAFRTGRVDATGTARSDSGVPMFPDWGNNGLKNACLMKTMQDLRTNLGMVLTNVNLFKKPGDKFMQFLVLKFEPAGTEFVLNEKQQPVVDLILGRVYEHLHGYQNPNGSWTLNTAHAVTSEVDPTAIRDVRIDADGEIHEERREALPSVEPAPPINQPRLCRS